MNKNELVGAVADKAGMSKADAGSAVEAVFDTITAELKGGGDVRLVGFGNFTVSHREASKGRNPMTGAEVDEMDLSHVPERYHDKIRTMLRKHATMWSGISGPSTQLNTALNS